MFLLCAGHWVWIIPLENKALQRKQLISDLSVFISSFSLLSHHKLLLRALNKCTMEKKWICAFLNTWRIKTSCSVDIQRYLNQRRLTSWIPIGLGRVNMFILGLWYLEGRLLLNRSSLGQSNLFYSKCHFYLVFSFFTDSLILFFCFVLLDPSVHILSNVQVMLFSLTIFCLLTCSQGNAQ